MFELCMLTALLRSLLFLLYACSRLSYKCQVISVTEIQSNTHPARARWRSTSWNTYGEAHGCD